MWPRDTIKSVPSLLSLYLLSPLTLSHSVYRNKPAAFSVRNNVALQRIVPLLLLGGRRKTLPQVVTVAIQIQMPCLVLHKVREDDGAAANALTCWVGLQTRVCTLYEKQQADCQDPSLNTFQSGLLWRAWALWSQLPTSTSVGSSLRAGTHSSNNPSFDPYSCCAVNLSGISAGERGHMDTALETEILFTHRNSPVASRLVRDILHACVKATCTSHQLPKQLTLDYPTPTFCKIALKDFTIPRFTQSKYKSDSKAFLDTTEALISVFWSVPCFSGSEQQRSKNTSVCIPVQLQKKHIVL